MKLSIKKNKNLTAYIKPLKWLIKNDDICAEPDGLRWKYYITPIEDKFELALIDDNCNWDRDYFKLYNSLSTAKNIAEKHYLKIIKSLFIKRTI